MGPSMVWLAGRPALTIGLCTGQVHHAAGVTWAPVPAQELHHPQVGGALGHLLAQESGPGDCQYYPWLSVSKRGVGAVGESLTIPGEGAGPGNGCCPLWGVGGVGCQDILPRRACLEPLTRAGKG